MSISKVRLPNNTEEDIKAKYLIQSSSSDVTSAEFSARTITEDAIANVQKIYGNTVAVSDNLDSNSATAILSREFNQWDEEWEEGTYNSSGQKTTGSRVRCKNYIPVIPGGSYFIVTYGVCYCYGSDKSFIGSTPYSSTTSGYLLNIPNNAYYITFAMGAGYGTVYNHDICINISDPSKNGTYEPYNGHQIDLNIPTLTGKLNGAGSSVVIFPEGMKKINTLTDELFVDRAKKVVGAVDLGTLGWTKGYGGFYSTGISSVANFSSAANTQRVLTAKYPWMTYSAGYNGSADCIFCDSSSIIVIKDAAYESSTAAQFKSAISGTELYYELKTPEEYILDNALQLQYPVVAGGTEMVLPTSGTAPMKMDVIYGNAADATSNLSSNFISVDSMKAFLNNLGTQMGGTWNMQYNNGKFEFTFSSS